jgi:HEAT repeat protein
MAAIGLGMIGEASVVERVAGWVELEEDTEEASFQRECAVIALSFVGVAAGGAEAGAAVRADVERRLVGALKSERPDVRFQAALAVAEVGDEGGEAMLHEALLREEHPEVRDSIVDALSRFGSPSPQTCAALVELVDSEEGATATGFTAAMVLAGAGRPEAGPRLVDALRVRHQRDQALEALAVLGERAPQDARTAVTALAHGWLTPGPTRARAAYALARLSGALTEDNPGIALLRKLAWHPRAAVREAVADAHKNLERLG